jgi:hypothetical protein
MYTLSRLETLSLKHYLAWSGSHGTVKAYNAHAQLLAAEATQEEILSLYKVKQLAMDLTGIKPSFVDLCPKSCMAFTGGAKVNKLAHTVVIAKTVLNHIIELRSSRAKPKPRATMLYMPITPIIQAYYANAETSHEMCHRDHCLKQTLDALAQGAGVKNSDNHIYHYEKLGLFHDQRDCFINLL